MVTGQEGRHRERARECGQEMGRLVADAVGNRRIDLVHKVLVVAVEFMWVDAHDGSLCCRLDERHQFENREHWDYYTPYLWCMALISAVYLPTLTKSYQAS